ncbi:MAG TPA: hypothetical protein VGE15_00080 [Sphingobacteriaceae bacterium]
MISSEVRFHRAFPSRPQGASGERSDEPDPAVPPYRTDTLQIAVKAIEKSVNYDSIFRSIRPKDKRETVSSPPPKPVIPRWAGPQKQPETSMDRQPSGYRGAGTQQNAPDHVADRQDLAARGVMTAGLTLILLGIVLELFLKRKGLAIVAVGMLALLAGVILL